MSLVGLTNGRYRVQDMRVLSATSQEKIVFLAMAEKNGNSAACNSNSAGVGFLSQFLLDKNENLPTCLLAHIRISA